MWLAVVALLFAVPLSAPFGDAEATALIVSEDGSAVLDVSVEVSGSPAAVLLRGIGLVDELPPVALSPRGDGTYGAIVELPTTAGVLLGFEFIPAGGGASTVSELHTLIELGVDPAALIGATPARPAGTTPPSSPISTAVGGGGAWGWLALAAGAAGVALLVVWLSMRKRDRVDIVSENAGNSVNADQESTSDPESGIR